jgi:UDP-N-acetylglucosamine acyltransferase
VADTNPQDLPLWDLPPAGGADTKIHPTAIVAKGAQIGRGVEIGPYCIIGAQAVIHDDVRLVANVIVENRTTIGSRTIVHPFATLGAIPQDLKYGGEAAELIIGTENSIRQYVNMSIGTEGGGNKTVVGRRSIFMVNVHIGHDSVVGDNCIFANGVSLGGHVTIGDHAVLGGHAAVHQFCHVGMRSMTAGGSMVVQDIPPFCMVHGDRAVINGLNVVGLRRAGFSKDDINDIKNMYRLLYSENLTVEDAILRMEAEIGDTQWRREFVNFLRQSERGVCR